VKFGRISIKVVAQEFLLRNHPVLKVEAMFAAAFLKDLICTLGRSRPAADAAREAVDRWLLVALM
jgi:hypothetical protein